MSADLTRYVVERPEGGDDGPDTDDYMEAKIRAEEIGGRVVAYEYEFADSYTVDDYSFQPFEDVATELEMHWNVDREEALSAVRSFADQGGDGSGMTFADQVRENTAYVVAEYMVDGGYVDAKDRVRCRHCGDWFAFEDDETHGGLCRGCDSISCPWITRTGGRTDEGGTDRRPGRDGRRRAAPVRRVAGARGPRRTVRPARAPVRDRDAG